MKTHDVRLPAGCRPALLRRPGAGRSGACVGVSRRARSILTPRPGPEPRIHGAKIFGVRPGSPFLFKIPATGERPLRYAASGLPEGLRLDPETGQISGRLDRAATHDVVFEVSSRGAQPAARSGSSAATRLP